MIMIDYITIYIYIYCFLILFVSSQCPEIFGCEPRRLRNEGNESGLENWKPSKSSGFEVKHFYDTNYCINSIL